HKPVVSVTPTSIGPYSTFSGRLIVIESTKRWQVSLKWQASRAEQGWLRITHAATGTVVELRWQSKTMQIRDNQQPVWRHIELEKLSEHGIIIPPHELAAILLGQMPAHFRQKSEQVWETRQSGYLIRLRWQQELRKLTITDMKHGRIAVLKIQP
ncbi:MAG: lipoprotein insertase outer membrane protein LolB, partial [Mariprofundus sp.]|nr:lipoprotein insertase outer membrane protein LolB [Mariprofundus sp.]